MNADYVSLRTDGVAQNDICLSRGQIRIVGVNASK